MKYQLDVKCYTSMHYRNKRIVEKRIGAFFDFDQTLLDTESSRLGIKYLWERRLVSRTFILKAFAAGKLYRHHLITDEQTAKILLRLYRNRRLAEFQEGSEAFYSKVLKPRLAPKILLVRKQVTILIEKNLLIL